MMALSSKRPSSAIKHRHSSVRFHDRPVLDTFIGILEIVQADMADLRAKDFNM